jgi:hypothetical protein
VSETDVLAVASNNLEDGDPTSHSMGDLPRCELYLGIVEVRYLTLEVQFWASVTHDDGEGGPCCRLRQYL